MCADYLDSEDLLIKIATESKAHFARENSKKAPLSHVTLRPRSKPIHLQTTAKPDTRSVEPMSPNSESLQESLPARPYKASDLNRM